MGLTWWYLTEKRLLKKPGYLLVLLLVPLLAWGMNLQSREEAGMVTIGLCAEERGGLAEELLGQMLEQQGVLRYLRYETEKEAIHAVESGKVSAAWIFPEKLEEKLQKMAEKGRITPVIRVVEREDDVSLVFTREVLCSHVYPSLAYQAYEGFVKRHLEEEIPEEMLRDFYQSISVGDTLFQAVYLDGTKTEEDDYLTAPIRGLLAIWVVVSGLSAILFYKRDESLGVYDAVPSKRRIRYAFGLQGVVLGNGGVIFLLACKLLGVLGQIGSEAFRLLLFLGCTACFCVLLGQIFSKMESFGVLIPILVILMIVACPIFLNIRLPWHLQGGLPAYFYLNSMHSRIYVNYMAIYLFALLGACLLGNLIKYRRG